MVEKQYKVKFSGQQLKFKFRDVRNVDLGFSDSSLLPRIELAYLFSMRSFILGS